MKIYKTISGILLENNKNWFRLPDVDFDDFINDDQLFEKTTKLTQTLNAVEMNLISEQIKAPIQGQELWACGVTYLRSKIGRQEESKVAGGSDFYAKVYEAERPEVFFKATAHRVVGHGAKVAIRTDSSWDVPEPELTLVVTSSGKIVGYTIGNDMSSRSIEGENPLYLPQAKTYDACASLGPCIYVSNEALPRTTEIRMLIHRDNVLAFSGNVSLGQMKRSPEELVSWVYKACSFPKGCLIMTGTGIVPGADFTLQTGDTIRIEIDGIGSLENSVR
jgi:2-dehydro-3-deoxy-D-arabinonate dehydratase